MWSLAFYYFYREELVQNIQNYYFLNQNHNIWDGVPYDIS